MSTTTMAAADHSRVQPKTAVISILKGGVGKTTEVGLIADAAVRFGLNVLVIDGDSQANLSRLMQCEVNLIPAESTGLGGHRALVTDRYTIEDIANPPRSNGLARHAVQEPGPNWTGYDTTKPFNKGGPLFRDKIGRLGIIPAYSGLEALSQTWQPSDIRRLRDSLYEPDEVDGIRPIDEWDLILIDSPPAPGPLARLAVAAADMVVLVSQAADYSVTAVKKTIEFLEDFQRARYVDHPLRIGGVAVNGWDEREVTQRAEVDRLVEILDERVPGGHEAVLWIEPIPARTSVKRSESHHRPLSSLLGTMRSAPQVCEVAEAHALHVIEALGLPQAPAIRAALPAQPVDPDWTNEDDDEAMTLSEEQDKEEISA